MKTVVWLLTSISLLLLSGCERQSVAQETQPSPLKKIQQFDVFIALPDVEMNALIEQFKQVGHLEMVDQTLLGKSPAVIFISHRNIACAACYELEVISAVTINLNEVVQTSSIWKTQYYPVASSYPIETDQGIVFQQEAATENTSNGLVKLFMKEYIRGNGTTHAPTFRIIRPLA